MLLVQLEPHVERKHRVTGCKTGPFWFPADLLHKESKRFYAERGVWPQVVRKITGCRSAHHVNIKCDPRNAWQGCCYRCCSNYCWRSGFRLAYLRCVDICRFMTQVCRADHDVYAMLL